MVRPDFEALGGVLRRRRLAMPSTGTGEPPMPVSEMRAKIGAKSDETVRRLESGKQFPGLKRLVEKILPEYGLALGDWVKAAGARSAGTGERSVAVLRCAKERVEGDFDHLPVTTRAANAKIVIESYGDGLLDCQDMSVTWIELGPGASTKLFQQEYGRSGHAHEGEELLIVVSGEVEFAVTLPDLGERTFTLRSDEGEGKGEGVLLKGHHPHHAHNRGTGRARYLVVWGIATPPRLTLL